MAVPIPASRIMEFTKNEEESDEDTSGLNITNYDDWMQKKTQLANTQQQFYKIDSPIKVASPHNFTELHSPENGKQGESMIEHQDMKDL